MFTDSEMQVLTARSGRLDVSRALVLQRRFVGGAEIGRASDEPGNILREDVQHFAGCLAARDSFRVGRENGEVGVPTVWEIAALHEINFRGELGIFCAVGGEELCPFDSGLFAAGAYSGCEVVVNAVRNQKLCVFGPAISTLSEADFFIAERLAVSFGSVLFIGRTPTDMTVENDEGRSALRLAKNREGVFDAIDVVGVAGGKG